MISKINFRTPICSTLNTTLYQLDAYVKSCRNTHECVSNVLDQKNTKRIITCSIVGV